MIHYCTVAMRQQGAWTNWEHASTRKITWPELWKSKPARLKFLIQSVYDVLPSPSKLHCWGLAEASACHLCPARGSLEHILSCCSKALGWCHDQVLKAVADHLESSRVDTSPQEGRTLHSLELERNLSHSERSQLGCCHQRMTGS